MKERGIRGTALAGVVLLALTAAACSSNDDDGGGTGDGTQGAGSAALTVKDFEFDPGSLTVASGETTITVTNDGAVEHNFSLDDGSVSQDIEPGESATVTVNVSADAPFHCKYHTQMTGTLTVG
jgi:plastocyanin